MVGFMIICQTLLCWLRAAVHLKGGSEPVIWVMGCRVSLHCTKQGPAPQLCLYGPPFLFLFSCRKLLTLVLKHSDLEKQDNSWKEVREVAGSWLQHCKILPKGKCDPEDANSVTYPHLYFSTGRPAHDSSLKTYEGPLLRSLLHDSSPKTL